MGDAVYELWIREDAIARFQKSNDLHRFTTARVKAETQAKLLDALLPTLPETVRELVKRAQNLPVPPARRSNQALYRKATAFEALVGYWYLHDPNLKQYQATILSLLASWFDPQPESMVP